MLLVLNILPGILLIAIGFTLFKYNKRAQKSSVLWQKQANEFYNKHPVISSPVAATAPIDTEIAKRYSGKIAKIFGVFMLLAGLIIILVRLITLLVH